jgi:hypothetical protein
MTRAEVTRVLRRRLPEIFRSGARIDVYEDDRVVFREIVDRSFRIESGGEQAAIALWFRPVGEPEREPRIRAHVYPIERARCLLIDRATQTRDGLSVDGPTGRALITWLEDATDIERSAGWIEYREVWLTPEDETVLDDLRS